jgi:hypothetical protein
MCYRKSARSVLGWLSRRIGSVNLVHDHEVEPGPGEEPGRKTVGWIGDVTIDTGETGPVVLVERRGNLIIGRLADPCDGEVPGLPIYEGDQLAMKSPISHVGLSATGEVGRTDDYLTGMRVIPVRQEGNVIYGRTLRRGEQDTGARIHVGPGEELRFDEGSITLELDAIDDVERQGRTGYVPVTPTLWTWFQVGAHDPAKVRYLLAAARRLDAAAQRVAEIEELRTELGTLDGQALALRRTVFRLIGAVESAVIALGRGCDMVARATELLGSTATVPLSISSSQEALTAIRNAYEHIEDRALGRVNKKPHPDALTIFDQSELLTHDRIRYGNHWHQPLRWPFVSSEACLGGLGQRPDTEGLAAGNLLAVVIIVTLAFQRQAKRLDIQPAAAGRIRCDHRNG